MYVYIKINAFNAFNFFKIVSLKDEIAMLKKLRCVWFAAHDTEGQPFSGNELGGGGGWSTKLKIIKMVEILGKKVCKNVDY